MIAVVGSRTGVNKADVEALVSTLRTNALISGGAAGVDTWAEQAYLARGGRVMSLRPVETENGWMIDEWRLGGDTPHIRRLHDHPSFEDFRSAALYRNAVIAERCESMHAFLRPTCISHGTQTAIDFARNEGKLVRIHQ